MSFDIKVMQPDDNSLTVARLDLQNVVLCQRIRLGNRNVEIQVRKPDDFVVQLRLSLMKTLLESRGILDLPFIDSVIRQVIKNFQTRFADIKKEQWALIAHLCWDEIENHERIEKDEIEPVDITEDDIDAWLNSEFTE